MAVIAFDVADQKEYVLKADKENPTVWQVGRIDHRLWTHLQDKHAHMEVSGLGAEAEGTVKFDINSRNDDFVRFGLKGWKNLADRNGNDVPFSTVSTPTAVGNRPGLSDRAMDMIRPYVAELAVAIEQFNGASEAETKN